MSDDSDKVWQRDEVESPCVKVCMIHPETRLCIGCNRSIDEIAQWSRLSVERRHEIMAELPNRQAAPKRRSGGRAARRRTS